MNGSPLNTVDMLLVPASSKEYYKATWKQMAPMIEARMCFSSLVIDKKNVYVFGGIKGNSKHIPIMVSNAIEHFTIETNKWEQFEVENAPILSAFSWGQSSGPSENLYIFGGSDGSLITSDLWSIDFKNKKAELIDAEFEDDTINVAMGKLAIRENPSEVSVHLFGGHGSEGANSYITLKEG